MTKLAPSALPFGPDWHMPKAITADEMARVRDSFVASARRAVRIGFDAIELHFAHGYLGASFFSPVKLVAKNQQAAGQFAPTMNGPACSP